VEIVERNLKMSTFSAIVSTITLFAFPIGISLYNSFSSSEETKKIEEKETEVSVKNFNQQDFHDLKEIDEECECMYGFKREEFKKNTDKILDSLQFHNKQIFILSGKKSTEWAKNEEESVISKHNEGIYSKNIKRNEKNQ
jgi:hypothetical protein